VCVCVCVCCVMYCGRYSRCSYFYLFDLIVKYNTLTIDILSEHQFWDLIYSLVIGSRVVPRYY